MIPLDDRYSVYWLLHTPLCPEVRKRCTVRPKRKKVRTTVQKIKPYMTNEEVVRALSEYDDMGYEQIPRWLKHELLARNFAYEKRQPTELEQWETVEDAREHRIMHKELTIKDFQDKYKRGKSLTLIT
jgi:hypothetical protein